MGTRGMTGHEENHEPGERVLESTTWNAFLDKPSADVLLDAIEFLGGTPNPQSLCRHLTLNVAAESRPIGALISVLETSGSLRIAGSFGLDEESLAACAEQTAADLSPLAEAIRSGQPIFHARAAGIRELFPEFSSRGFLLVPTAIWPISSRGERIGAIQLFFDEHSLQSPLTADFEPLSRSLRFTCGFSLRQGLVRTDGRPRSDAIPPVLRQSRAIVAVPPGSWISPFGRRLFSITSAPAGPTRRLHTWWASASRLSARRPWRSIERWASMAGVRRQRWLEPNKLRQKR